MIARVAVGVVLLASGAAKLGQPAWPATAAAFGAPAGVARALPWVELVLGGLVAAGVGLPWSALAAAGMLAAFTVAVGARLARGDAVPCGCFGETSPEPVGLDTVVRNLLLVALALVGAATDRSGGSVGAAALGAAAGLVVVAVAGRRPGRAARR